MTHSYDVSVASHSSYWTYDADFDTLAEDMDAVRPYMDYSDYCSSIYEDGDIETCAWTNLPSPL